MNTTTLAESPPGHWLEPTREDLEAIYRVKYYRFGEPGWGPRMRRDFGYYTADDVYEAVVSKLVTPGAQWADIGCGRDVFPQNPDLARELAGRAGYLYGIDPDDNVKENPFLNDRFHGVVEDCDTERTFDVVTLRMVAEHIVDPERAVARIASLTKPGGRAVVYTPHKWSPMSIAASITPFWLHHPLKRLIWDAQARDTFPTAYKLNTHADMHGHFAAAGMREVFFRRLDDCSIFARYRVLNWLDLSLRTALNRVGLHHPETCLLGVFEKPAAS